MLQVKEFRQKIISWGEAYFYNPTLFMKFISFTLLPFSFIYCAIVVLKRKFSIIKTPPLPTISIGNLTLGGSGKTPLTIALASKYSNPAIVLRGYKRQSKGVICVSCKGNILCDVKTSGDEAMLYAKSLPNATVIVSEDRLKGIIKAKEKGANCVFLDDGFSKSYIEKFDLLIRSKLKSSSFFCIPSGPYRSPIWFEKYADLIIEEEKDFARKVSIKNPTSKMALVTAIANPSRLKKFLPKNLCGYYFFEDHYMYSEDELQNILKISQATSLLVTTKDAVKMEGFNLPLSILDLKLDVKPSIHKKIASYINTKKIQ